jgi:RND superfamily putative drug exporter
VRLVIFRLIGRFAVKFRWIIIILWIAAVPLVLKTLPSLSSVTKTDNSSFLPKKTPSLEAANLVKPFQGGETSITSIIVASRETGELTTSDEAAITKVETAVRGLHNISFVRDQGVSGDGKAEQILIGANGSTFGPDTITFVKKIRDTMHSVAAPPGLQFHLTGSLAEAVDSQNSDSNTRNSTQDYSLIFIVILLVVVYRSVLAPIITLLPAGLSLVIAGPVIAEATKAGVEVSPITQLLLIVLLLGAGTDYGLFLVFRVREELRRGLEPKEAVVEALTKVGEAITFSAATVSAALISLLLASFGFYKGLGPALAIGLGILLLSALTLLPALLSIFGRVSFWPSKTKAGEFKLGLWGRIADKVVHKPVHTLVAGTLILGALSIGMIHYKTGGFSNASPAQGSDSAQGSAVIAAHFPASNNDPEVLILRFGDSVWSSPTAAHAAQEKFAASGFFTSITGPFGSGKTLLPAAELSTLHKELGSPQNLSLAPPAKSKIPIKTYQEYRSLSQFISPDGRTVQYYALFKGAKSGSSVAASKVPAARAEITSVAQSVGAQTSGLYSQDAFVYDINHSANSDLELIVPVVLLIIAVLLALLLRSLVAPWYLIASVGLSYVATLGFAVTVFVVFGNSKDGINFILPFLLFIFSMALGEDYNILVMSRVREEAMKEHSFKEAIVHAIGITGSTVTSAGLILAGTFTVLGLSSGGDAQVQQIGFAIAFGILLDTFFVRTLFVPSIAILFGRWNWWPSKLSRRIE